MGPLLQADERAFLWLNGWVGRFPWLDGLARLVVSDYLVPVLFSLVMLGLWFTGQTPAARERNQRGVMAAILSIALANLTVEFINQFVYRPRPFATMKVSLLFYKPTDSSFPANAAVLGFAVAVAIWCWNRRIGTVLLGMAMGFSLSRVYAGISYPLDILGGSVLGGLAGLLVVALLRWLEPIPSLVLRLTRIFYLT